MSKTLLLMLLSKQPKRSKQQHLKCV